MPNFSSLRISSSRRVGAVITLITLSRLAFTRTRAYLGNNECLPRKRAGFSLKRSFQQFGATCRPVKAYNEVQCSLPTA